MESYLPEERLVTSCLLQIRRCAAGLFKVAERIRFLGGLLCLAQAIAACDASQTTASSLPHLVVNPPSGWCETPVKVKITSPLEGTVIRYTVDGSEPTLRSGNDYSGPVAITNTTILRAAAFKEKARVSSIALRSYVFLDQVLQQPSAPPGFSSGSTAWNGRPSAYQMDSRVVADPLYRDRMRDALKSLPLLFLVCRNEDLFDPKTGIYLNSLQTDESWERPCSAELVALDGKTEFQIDCGIQIQGGQSRVPFKSPKHSFRLLFKAKYGEPKLDYRVFADSPVSSFNTLVLRADFNNSWIHWDALARPRAQRTRDAWLKDTHRAMGWIAGHNRYLHLFLNGLYWGIYDATERPDASFAAAYFGGSRKDYDVINESKPKDGTLDAFNALGSIRGLGENAQYDKLKQFLNLTQYIDYLLLNYYAGNQDVGERKNWYAIRRRKPAGPFQYLVWDGEQILHDVNDDTVSTPFEVPFRMAQELRANAEFRLAFADRVQKHFFEDGALTPVRASERWMKRAAELDRAIIAESARWGYYRRNPPFTRDKDWLAEQQRLVSNYFPQRTGVVLEQLRSVGLYPRIAAPVFNHQGGKVQPGFNLVLTSPRNGKIYYTATGSDPRVYGTGAVSPDAQLFGGRLTIRPPLKVKARAFEDDTWSALTEIDFGP